MVSLRLLLAAVAFLVSVSVIQADGSLPIVILGTQVESNACAGVAITTQHVLVHLSCMDSIGAITTASLLDPDDREDSTDQDRVQVTSSITVPFQDTTPSQADSTTPQVALRILTLQAPLVLDPVVLPLGTAYPAAFETDEKASVFSIDLNTMETTHFNSVVYFDNRVCSQQVCLFPADTKARTIPTQSNPWSFLLKRHGDRYWLFGLGGTPVTSSDGFWGFYWLPKVLTSSLFTTLRIEGVETVTSVTKEATKTINVEFGHIVGLRSKKDGKSFCLGNLISPFWILTAAHCSRKGEILYAVTYGDGQKMNGAVIGVNQTIVHPSYMRYHIDGLPENDFIHISDLMLVQLKEPAMRTFIKLISPSDELAPAIANAYTARSYSFAWSNGTETIQYVDAYVHYRQSACNRLMAPTKILPDPLMLCLQGTEKRKPCVSNANATANIIVILPTSWERRLLAIGSTDLACNEQKLLAAGTRVSAYIDPFVTRKAPEIDALLTFRTPTIQADSPPPVTRVPPVKTPKPTN
ncbi:hypothetical protein Poli38472_011481 [Pythium oligandrum]|uniref:Peptidase S1 domain-containing protein n=1 Tax=Pythium oligandrum TaxID=41045 RepID=A0A8K1CKW6_PYTOL|nr:hypothetical protein Poli38472_011481 [Pythium oligandrum]|eukprot:TMW64601.1 hypothetical protein Poli38472_011481 [Pythium oligandrum]